METGSFVSPPVRTDTVETSILCILIIFTT